eukprot:CAMPEP_0170611348 /NCGR_PEP_ID=MMETSP0224-20130122/23142_1 /TAXON_ID=285029 /ORGANISM="Togula jolla, Strain CCCM 725" /LENGTH=135 /DNA_ID=CAMNT_0010936779 /DNA_START=363 /DNA_END=770 /DNA_ORIENTATION=+
MPRPTALQARDSAQAGAISSILCRPSSPCSSYRLIDAVQQVEGITASNARKPSRQAWRTRLASAPNASLALASLLSSWTSGGLDTDSKSADVRSPEMIASSRKNHLERASPTMMPQRAQRAWHTAAIAVSAAHAR